MGFWNDGIRSPSPSRRSSSGKKTYYATRPAYSRSASSFFSSFSGNGNSRSYSSSRARPRNGFMAKLRRFLRDIIAYMRKHPIKVFMLVIMPLITGGALTKILSQFGVRLPRSLENMVGSGMSRGGYERFYSRGGARDYEGGSALPGMGGGVGESLGSLIGIARAFM
jgi:hypothetical protein